MSELKLDRFDRRILALLQQDCTLPVAELAERVGLGPTACWRRIQKLEEQGVIRQRVALLDKRQLRASVTVFVSIRTNYHNQQWLQEFHQRVTAIEEVMEIYRMAGDTDYLLRLAVPDIEGYDAVYKQLIQIPGLSDVSSSFAMEQLKYSTALPLRYIPD